MAGLIAVLAQAADAAPAVMIDIPAGRLADALVALGVQAGVTVGVADAALDGQRIRAVRGRMPAHDALRRMLKDSGLDFVAVDSHTFRIVARRASAPSPTAPPAPLTMSANSDIVVTASKRQTLMADFPGTLSVIAVDNAMVDRAGRAGTDAIVDALPSMASTHLGPGRNKLIIRGVADSSFTGPTQAVVGQYLGDVRLNYNAPDPDLNLYDMKQIEVLEGPQGTLYGAGSLGGIVRLVPNMPDLTGLHGSVAAGIGLTENGRNSNDVAAMLNVPLIGNVVGARAVLYRSVDGGYIDDAARGLSDVNRSTTKGGRVDLRIEPGDGWTIDLGATSQDIDNADSQYAERGEPRYVRRSAIAQPFDNDYRLAQVTVAKNWGTLNLVSATGAIRHEVAEVYDATLGAPTPIIFDQNNRITLLTNETRLSKRRANGTGWLIGTSFISNRERLTRNFVQGTATTPITGVRNIVTQVATYGEVSFTLLDHVTATTGARLSYSRLSGELIGRTQQEGEPSRSEVEVLPSVALNWHPKPTWTLFARYQEGFRPGGLSVQPGTTRVVSQRFQGDSIATFEAGARLGDPVRSPVHGAISLSYAHWEHIQADLVDAAGLPYTANLGNGRLLGLEASIGVRLFDGIHVEGGLFLNDSELVRPDPGFEDAAHAELPDVAELGGRLALSFRRPIAGDWTISGSGSIRYFGHSRLGVGTLLDIEQGNYADTRLNARLGTDRWGFVVDVTNLAGAAGNRFALGNPFGVMARRQVTPLAPRTVRLGIDARF